MLMLRLSSKIYCKKLINLKSLRVLRYNVRFYANEATDILHPASSEEKVYPKHIEKIVDDIAQLNILEVSDLNELLQKKLNIKPAESLMMSAIPATGAVLNEEEEAKPTKTSYSVKLLKFEQATKVPLIKEIKNIVPEMNLVQAKKFVESAPEFLQRDLSKDEAEAMKKALEAVGGTVEIE